MDNRNKCTITSLTKSLILLSRYVRILGLAPSYIQQENAFIIYNLQKCWNLLILLTFLTIFLYVGRARVIIYILIQIWKTWLIMEPITAVSVIYINVFSIVSGSFLNAASHVKIWNVLLEVDQELSTHFDGKILVKTRNLFVKLLTVHFQPLFVFIWICYGRITDPKYTSSRFGIFLLENVQRYHIGNLVVLMQHLKFSIKTQFDNINEILKMYLNTDVSPTVLDVIRLRNAYVVLLEQMQNFNRVFGKTIFLFFFMGMISYLMCFSSITVSKTGHKLLQTAYYLSMTIINLFTILVIPIFELIPSINILSRSSG